MKIHLFQLLFFGLFCIDCIEEIPFDSRLQSPETVLNALITDGQKIQLHLTETISISQNQFPEIKNAQITIFNDKDGNLIDSLHYSGNFRYTGNSLLSIYDTPLRLNIEIGDKKLWAQTYIPKPVPIVSVTEIYPAGYDEYGDGMIEYRIEFLDPVDEENYYELFFFDRSSIHSNEHLAYLDPVIRSEGLEGYDNKSLLFSDRLFNGELAKIIVKYLPIYIPANVGSLIDLTQVESGATYALLRTVSKEYYDYRRGWVIHRYSQQNKPDALKKDPILEDFSRFLFVGDPVELNPPTRIAF